MTAPVFKYALVIKVIFFPLICNYDIYEFLFNSGKIIKVLIPHQAE